MSDESLQKLTYMHGTDEVLDTRLVYACARTESIARWIACVVVIGTQWHWMSLSSPISIFFLLAAFVAVPFWALTLGFTLIQSIPRTKRPLLRWSRRSVSLFVSVFLAVSAIATSWPFYVSFYLSLPFLNHLADQASSGQVIVGPRLCGMFYIDEVRVEPDGSVGVYFDRTTSGWCGLVRYSSQPLIAVSSNNGRVHLVGSWELVDED